MKGYYQNELDRLRRLAREFAAEHPAMAPFLGEQGADPDVERLLEGVAYLCGLVQQRMDAGFPELVQSLIWLTFPSLLYPSPSLCLVRFTSKPGIVDPLPVSRGAELASLPVDGVSCRYSLMRDMQILPVDAAATSVEILSADEAVVTLKCAPRAPLARWWPESLRIYLGGDYSQASRRLHCLLSHLSRVTVTTRSGSFDLPPSSLTLDFDVSRSWMPLENHVPYWMLRTYFTFPHAFLFLSLGGLNHIPVGADDTVLSFSFHLKGDVKQLPDFPADSFLFNVAPVANVFPHSAEPIRLDHTREDYLVRPENAVEQGLAIIRVESVKGIRQGGEIRAYRPYENFSLTRWNGGTYTLRQTRDATGRQSEIYLAVLHPEDTPDFTEETLSINLRCHSPQLAARLGVGDICQPTDTSPAMATFANIVVPSAACAPQDDESTLWRFLSHLHVNLLSMASAESLKSMLRLHVPEESSATHASLSGLKKIDAIEQFRAWNEDRLFRGTPLRGRALSLKVDPRGFASTGDLYLFGSLLERVLAAFATINSTTRLEIETSDNLETLVWPARLGRKQLL